MAGLEGGELVGGVGGGGAGVGGDELCFGGARLQGSVLGVVGLEAGGGSRECRSADPISSREEGDGPP